jgi:hypothetical protein
LSLNRRDGDGDGDEDGVVFGNDVQEIVNVVVLCLVKETRQNKMQIIILIF